MEIPKIWKEYEKEKSNFSKNLKIQNCICSWSDLLGFGQVFKEANWDPTKSEWKKLLKRLIFTTDRIIRMGRSPSNYTLVLNDGIVHNLDIDVLDVFLLDTWFKELALCHCNINDDEKKMHMPGIRTVISHGKRAQYSIETVTFDDLFFFLKRNKNEKEPILLSNHKQLQMNTAFSKAFLINESGSKAGLSGPKMYIERKVFDFLKILAVKKSGITFVEDYTKNGKFALWDTKKDDYIIQFDFENIIKYNECNINTDLFCIKKYYPWDDWDAITNKRIIIDFYNTEYKNFYGD